MLDLCGIVVHFRQKKLQKAVSAKLLAFSKLDSNQVEAYALDTIDQKKKENHFY